MAKLPHQSTVPPVDDQDASTKAYADASGGGSGGGATPLAEGVMNFTGVIFNGAKSAAPSTGTTSAEDFTLECWFTPNVAAENGTLIDGHQFTVGNYRLRMITSGTQVSFQYNELNFGSFPNHVFNLTPVVGRWYHIALVRTKVDGRGTFYLNGKLVGFTVDGNAIGADALVTAPQVSIGSQATNFADAYNGQIAEARIWGTARTADEIAENFANSLKGNETGLLALYKGADFTDSGPNANDLAVTGTPTIVAAQAGRVTAHSLSTDVADILLGGAAPGNGDVLTADGAGGAAFVPPSGATDADAIHDNVAGEINAITAKATPVAADVILIEDSADSFNKKKATLTDLLGGGGSSGPIAAAQGDYIHASLGADQVNPAVAAAIDFDTVRTSRGELTVDGAGKLSGLKPGRTYLIEAGIGITDTALASLEWQIYDVTGAPVIIPGTLSFSLAEGGSSVFTRSPSISTAILTPSVDTAIELRVTVNTGGCTVRSDVSYLRVVEIGAVQADVVGGLEFMDIIEVTADQTTVSFGAAGDGAFQRALDGDVDETYVIEGRWTPPAGISGAQISLLPNGISTNQDSVFTTASGAGQLAASEDSARLMLARSSFTASTSHQFEAQFYAKTGGVKRHVLGSAAEFRTDTNTVLRPYAGSWGDIATNVTSLELLSSEASGLKIGSYFVLYRRTRTNLRADSAAVYERMAVETITPGALVTTERTVGHSIYGGSVVGVSARIEKTITGGSVTVNVKVDGSTVLSTVLDTTNPTSKVERLAIGQAKFAADKNISVEFVPAGVGFAPPSVPVPITVQVHLTNDALITQNDRVVVRTELTANSNLISLTGLNGDLDGEYEIAGRIKYNTLLANVTRIEPNGLTTDMLTKYSFDSATAVGTVDGQIVPAGVTTTAGEFIFRMRFWAKRGDTRRGFEANGNFHFNLNAINMTHLVGVLANDTSNITSIDFTNTIASGFLAGSWVEVRRVKA